jgi:hypothetical protein
MEGVMRLIRTAAFILATAMVPAPVLASPQAGAPADPPAPQTTASSAAPVARGPNQLGVAGLVLFQRGTGLVPVGDGSVMVGGSVWGDASPGFEVFYARRLPLPAGFPMMTLELPLAYVPTVRPAPGSEVFDPATGASIGPAPDFAATYFVPRLNVWVPAFGPVNLLAGLGFGVARFSESRSGQPYQETGYPFYFALGASVDLGPHWAIRASAGGYAHGVAWLRNAYMLNAGLAFVF